MSDKVCSDRLLNVDVFLVLLLRLGILETFAKSEHTTAAVFVIAAIVVVAQTITGLGCLHK